MRVNKAGGWILGAGEEEERVKLDPEAVEWITLMINAVRDRLLIPAQACEPPLPTCLMSTS